MQLKEWLSYERVWTRKEILKVIFMSSFPFGFCGYTAGLLALLIKPNTKDGRWKKPNKRH